jgi:hypothetical protein
MINKKCNKNENWKNIGWAINLKLIFRLPEHQRNSYWRGWGVILSLIFVLILTLGAPFFEGRSTKKAYIDSCVRNLRRFWPKLQRSENKEEKFRRSHLLIKRPNLVSAKLFGAHRSTFYCTPFKGGSWLVIFFVVQTSRKVISKIGFDASVANA